MADRNVPDLCWWLIERATSLEDFDARWAGVAATLVRVLVSLPLEALSDEEKRDEAFLRGKILNGIPRRRATNGRSRRRSSRMMRWRSYEAGTSYGKLTTSTFVSHWSSLRALE